MTTIQIGASSPLYWSSCQLATFRVLLGTIGNVPSILLIRNEQIYETKSIEDATIAIDEYHNFCAWLATNRTLEPIWLEPQSVN